MPEPFKPGCKRPEIKNKAIEPQDAPAPATGQEYRPMVKVGKPAPHFSAPAYLDGGFVNVDLDEYKGSWVLVCFYPGDFTFV